MALRHAAVLRNPGSYVMSPTSPADVLICRRSTARIAPSWIGISYCLPVRLSTTARVSLGTRGILDFGWEKKRGGGGGGRQGAALGGRATFPPVAARCRPLIWGSDAPPRASQARQPLPDPLGRGCAPGPAARGSGVHRLHPARRHARGC